MGSRGGRRADWGLWQHPWASELVPGWPARKTGPVLLSLLTYCLFCGGWSLVSIAGDTGASRPRAHWPIAIPQVPFLRKVVSMDLLDGQMLKAILNKVAQETITNRRISFDKSDWSWDYLRFRNLILSSLRKHHQAYVKRESEAKRKRKTQRNMSWVVPGPESHSSWTLCPQAQGRTRQTRYKAIRGGWEPGGWYGLSLRQRTLRRSCLLETRRISSLL